jgi:branched-chain amino acid transport system permease protein
LRLKLFAATTSGAIMGMAGAPLPFYNSYLNPDSAFAVGYTINAMAMPLVGGTQTWLGPVLGALLLGAIQQFAVAFVSSSVSLALIGLVFMGFVALAPQGLIGLFRSRRAKGAAP